jgi:serine/threonine-protein kinase RsbT
VTDAVLVLAVGDDADGAVAVRRVGKEAEALGMTEADRMRLMTAASELVTNILKYARRGTLSLRRLGDGGRAGLEVVAEDRGPGIADVSLALQDRFSTAGTLGLGLPGVRRLMDEFEISSTVGRGTRVRVRKWRP